jgi:pimeloyl-ACP methyl ester carboxylesterase
VSIEQCTADATALIEGLGAPVHFVGLSMGGFVGMRVAARRPDLVRSLALLGTAADPEPPENVSRYRLLNLAARLLGVTGPLADRVVAIMAAESTRTDPARAAELAEVRSQLVANQRSIWKAVNGVLERDGCEHELSQIRCPTTVIRGTEDAAIALPRARRLHEAIAGSRWREVPRAGHSATLEAPAEVNALLDEHLAWAAA